MDVRLIEGGATGEPTVVEVEGDLDLVAARQLEEPLMGVIATAPGPVLIDLAACPFIDSNGLRLMLRAEEAASVSAGARRLCVVATGHVADMFKVTTLDVSIPIRPSREDALAALAAWSGDRVP